jgi:hypothetical protein
MKSGATQFKGAHLGKVRFILTSVVGTNSDPSDEIHLWIIISFFLLPPQVTPGTLSSTPRQVSRVKSSTPEESTFRLKKHTPALGSSGGRHRIPEGSRGRPFSIAAQLLRVLNARLRSSQAVDLGAKNVQKAVCQPYGHCDDYSCAIVKRVILKPAQLFSAR